MSIHTQHLFNRGTQNLTALSLSILCIITITPFAIYRTYTHNWPIAIIDWLIILSQLLAVYLCYRYPSRHFPEIIVAVMFSAGSLASLYIGGESQLYWLYPATVAFYVLTDHIKGAFIASITVTVAALICLIPLLATKHTIIVLFTLTATNGFGFVFAFMNSRRDRALSKLARLDSLTNVNNRRALNEALQTLTSSPTVNSQLSCLAIIDLDNFKQINDQYGHLVGDEILTTVSRILLNFVDQPKNLYRYGGDEFIYISPQGDLDFLENSFIQLQALLAAEPSNIIKQVTLSVGIAQYKNNEDAGQWLHRADTALFKAKLNGKNQINLSA